jgi:small basic protein (TIGR04137 family)
MALEYKARTSFAANSFDPKQGSIALGRHEFRRWRLPPKNAVLRPAKVLPEINDWQSRLGHVTYLPVMSQHRSLRAAAALGGKRNVLKRFERIELLKKREQWKPGDRITGLRKTKREA